MDEMTIERACEILNEAKWRERDDWQIVQWSGQEAIATPIGSHRQIGQAAANVLYVEDAIALTTGIEAQRELAQVTGERDYLEQKYHVAAQERDRIDGELAALRLAAEQLAVRVKQDGRDYYDEYDAVMALLATEPKEGESNG